mgnify:CR=1 FL=1
MLFRSGIDKRVFAQVLTNGKKLDYALAQSITFYEANIVRASLAPPTRSPFAQPIASAALRTGIDKR